MAVNKDTTDRKVVSVPKEMSARISAYWHQKMLKSEADAIRKLIEKGLEAEECCKKCNFAAGRDEEGSPIIGGGTEGGAGA